MKTPLYSTVMLHKTFMCGRSNRLACLLHYWTPEIQRAESPIKYRVCTLTKKEVPPTLSHPGPALFPHTRGRYAVEMIVTSLISSATGAAYLSPGKIGIVVWLNHTEQIWCPSSFTRLFSKLFASTTLLAINVSYRQPPSLVLYFLLSAKSDPADGEFSSSWKALRHYREPSSCTHRTPAQRILITRYRIPQNGLGTQ